MRYASLWEALLDGAPGPVFVASSLAASVVVGVAVWWARRTIPASKGKPTAYDICDRVDRENAAHDHDVQSGIERSRYAEFQRFAREEAERRADVAEALVEVLPASEIPRPRRGTRPYVKLQPQQTGKVKAA